MAGLIAANGSLHGIAPDVSFLVVKVITSAGFGSSTEVADGIRFCLDPFGDGTRGADVISISLGSKNPLFVATDVSRAAQLALDRGVFVIASAGNNGLSIDNTDVEIPANVPLAIAVGAVDSGGRIAPFSSMGADLNRTDPNRKPEVVAPGVQVITTAPGAHYVTSSGTSPATAIVAGVVALLLQARPGLKPAGTTANILLLKWALVRSSTAGPGQVLPHDARYGYGIISGNRALSYL
jgi:subtilisin family serine protease